MKRWPRDRKELLARCADAGLEVSRTASGHTRIKHPDRQIYVTCSSSPRNAGDAAQATARDVKRYLGVDLRR